MPALLTRMSRPPKRSTRRDHGLDLGASVTSARTRARRAPSTDGDALGAVAVAIGDDDLRALGNELASDAFAEPRRSAGDDGDLSCEAHGASPSRSSGLQPWWIATVFRVEKP